MKIRTSIAAAAAAALVAAGAFLLPGVAGATTATHTLKFISAQKATATFSSNMIGEQDTDFNAKGAVIGFDEVYVAFGKTTTADGWVTVDVDGGFIYGTFLFNTKTGAITNGTVTGGARAFKGATGTFTIKALSATKNAVTLTYSV